MASNEFIKAKLDKKLSPSIYNACYNLSVLLGDDNGYLTRSTIKAVIDGLDVTAPGYVLVGQTSADQNSTLSVLPSVHYVNEISRYAYNLYAEMQSTSNSFLSEGSAIDSVILKMVDPNTPTYLKSIINSLYVEALALYYDLLSATSSDGLLRTTRSDLTRFDSNIRWISDRLESRNKIPYGLVSVMRDLQRTVVYVRSLDYLFEQTYANKLSKGMI